VGKVQAGLETDDWKPFGEVGPGTREIRIRESSGIYRVMYVAKFEEAIYVLHCFQKKTRMTRKQDAAIAAARYRTVVRVRKGRK
jgi:phage-related protein